VRARLASVGAQPLAQPESRKVSISPQLTGAGQLAAQLGIA
jgi:hypothetical protein